MEGELNTNELGTENDDKGGDDKTQEVDYGKVDPDKLTHQQIAQTEAFKGLMREVQGLREKVQDLGQSNEMLSSEIERQSAEANSGEDEDYITLARAKDLVGGAIEQEKDKMKKEEEKRQQQEQIIRQNKSVEKFFSELSKNKVAGIPDGQTIIQKGGLWLQANRPALFKVATESDDPARDIYDLALTYVPEFKNVRESALNTKFMEQMKSASIPGGQSTGEPEPESDFEKLFDLASKGADGFALAEKELMQGEDPEDDKIREIQNK